MMSMTDSDKPLLTTYLPAYSPDEPVQPALPQGMNFHYYTDDGIPMFVGYSINENPTRPVPGKFLSGHFLFTLGQFVHEVPYNPALYFHGEEITLAVRAYTWGYDLFAPHESVAYHEYSRKYRMKHWDDHDKSVVDIAWWERDRDSKAAVVKFLKDPHYGQYGIGRIRTMDQYRVYCGIDPVQIKA
jgi:hypothetical protein